MYKSLESRYHELLSRPSDMQAHMTRLASYASQCEHVTEFGVRGGVSTTSFLYGRPKAMRCYDIQPCPCIELLRPLAPDTDLQFTQADTTTMPVIEETDLLFIDTEHSYECLSKELARHAGKARKWIILHDTEVYGQRGERDYEPHDDVKGLWPAVEEFVAQGEWEIEYHTPDCYGLTILRRTGH